MYKKSIRIKMLFLFLISFSLIFGALPPQVLIESQQQSKEYIEIEVKNVKCISQNELDISVELNAIILKKYRTDSDLKPGDTIIIKYNTYKTNVNNEESITVDIEGPLPIPILEKNKKYDAFLKFNDDTSYSPNAGCLSFIEK